MALTQDITIDLTDGAAQGDTTGELTFSLVDLNDGSVIRRAPGPSADETSELRENFRVTPKGIRQFRIRISRGVVDGTGENRVLGEVAFNATLTFPPFADAAEISQPVQAFLALLKGDSSPAVGKLAEYAAAGTLP